MADLVPCSSTELLLISWLQSPSAVIWEPRKIKSATVSPVSPSIHNVFKKCLGLEREIKDHLLKFLTFPFSCSKVNDDDDILPTPTLVL